jgi:hypothetical protein
MARAATITNGIRIPASAFTATYRPQERQRIDRNSGNVWAGKGGSERSITAAYAIVIV